MGKSSVYTRGGDKGETSLVNGSRISKSDSRIDLYGDVDELNSSIGFMLALFEEKSILDKNESEFIKKIQSSLFDLGSKLACENEFWEKYKLPDIQETTVLEMEASIDNFDGKLEKLKYFVLPGGTKESAQAHISRTICRRVERKLISFGKSEEVPVNSLVFLNRLSDYLFVVARFANLKLGIKDIPWIP